MHSLCKSMLNRFLPFLMILIFLLSGLASGEETEDYLSSFIIRHGSREESRIALTVDDCFDLEYTWKIGSLFSKMNVFGTFFPIGSQIHEEDRENWVKLIDSGNEIGSHNFGHYKMGNSNFWGILSSLGRHQQALDAALGFHYQIHCFRPPFGNMEDENGERKVFESAVRRFGYEHVILWDVSQTVPEKAFSKVKPGSILLFHARKKDYECLEKLIPQLSEAGYEMVTVSQLLGFGQNEVSPYPYTYSRSDYEGK